MGCVAVVARLVVGFCVQRWERRCVVAACAGRRRFYAVRTMRTMTILAALLAVRRGCLLGVAAIAVCVFAPAAVVRIVAFLAVVVALRGGMALGSVAALARFLRRQRAMFVVALIARAMTLFFLGLRMDRLMAALARLRLLGTEGVRRVAFGAGCFSVEVRVAMRSLMAARARGEALGVRVFGVRVVAPDAALAFGIGV